MWLHGPSVMSRKLNRPTGRASRGFGEWLKEVKGG
ncbi:hypothetical protein VRRI112168_00325 [Vreelandella rituensis]